MKHLCKHVKREGESCPKNNKCRYPDCVIEQLQKQVEELRGSAKEVLNELRQDGNPYELWCDHEVGICSCAINYALDRLEQALNSK